MTTCTRPTLSRAARFCSGEIPAHWPSPGKRRILLHGRGRTHRRMPLRGRPVQRSRRAGTCQALPLRKLQEGIWERVYGLRALAARSLRDERGNSELRRTGLLPPLRLTSTGQLRPRRYPHRDSDRDARRRGCSLSAPALSPTPPTARCGRLRDDGAQA